MYKRQALDWCVDRVALSIATLGSTRCAEVAQLPATTEGGLCIASLGGQCYRLIHKGLYMSESGEVLLDQLGSLANGDVETLAQTVEMCIRDRPSSVWYVKLLVCTVQPTRLDK